MMIGHIELTHPWLILVALAAVPLFFLARRAGGRVVFSSLDALPASGASWRTALAWLPDALIALGAAGLALALAGPRTGDEESRIHSEGIAIVMAVDTSSSMRALDLAKGKAMTTRLDAVKKVFEDFVLGKGELHGRPDDAIGIVSFAGYADNSCPLTLDHQMVASIADSLQIVTNRKDDGTAIGDGLGLAVDRLSESKAHSKVIILLTDGVNNTGIETPTGAAQLAAEKGIKVYTIGAGTNGMAPVQVTDPFTGRPALRAMPVEIDETTLKAIAKATGGAYFRATDADSLRDIYDQIDKLERTKLDETRYTDYHQLYVYPLALGLLLLALGWLGRESLWRRLP